MLTTHIRPATPGDIPVLSDIHAEGMPRDFMVRLGRTFQSRVLFPTMLEAPGAHIYVVDEGGEVLGFLITRFGLGGLVGQMLGGHPLWFTAAGLGSVLRHPTLLGDALSVLAQLHTRGAEPEPPGPAELFLMAVGLRARRRGVGRALVEHSAAELRASGVTLYRVLLHADNQPADRLYARTGFAEKRRYCFAGQWWCERERRL